MKILSYFILLHYFNTNQIWLYMYLPVFTVWWSIFHVCSWSLLRYKIDNLYSERFYLVNARILFCYEALESCNEAYTLLENTMLPKITCSWDEGFLIPGIITRDKLSLAKRYSQLNHVVDIGHYFEWMAYCKHINFHSC